MIHGNHTFVHSRPLDVQSVCYIKKPCAGALWLQFSSFPPVTDRVKGIRVTNGKSKRKVSLLPLKV